MKKEVKSVGVFIQETINFINVVLPCDPGVAINKN
jgi:hypothetical protein